MKQPVRYDVIIAGAGMAGATFALAAAQSGLKVVLVDPQPFEAQLAPSFDGRSTAIAFSTFRMLYALGVGMGALVAHEVGVDVAGGERPRTVLHESTADLVLVEREVAGRWIEDQVDAPGRERRPWPGGHPGVLADLKAHANPAAGKPEVTDRHVAVADRHHAPATANPRPEPPGLVVDAVAGEILLAGDARDPPIDDEGRCVKEAALEADRQPYRHGDPASGRHDLAKHLERHPLHPG